VNLLAPLWRRVATIPLTHGAAVLSREIRGQYFGILAPRPAKSLGCYAGSAWRFVIGNRSVVYRCYRSNNLASNAPEAADRMFRPRDIGCQKNKRIDPPSVDRQIHDLLRADHLGNVGLGVCLPLSPPPRSPPTCVAGRKSRHRSVDRDSSRLLIECPWISRAGQIPLWSHSLCSHRPEPKPA